MKGHGQRHDDRNHYHNNIRVHDGSKEPDWYRFIFRDSKKDYHRELTSVSLFGTVTEAREGNDGRSHVRHSWLLLSRLRDTLVIGVCYPSLVTSVIPAHSDRDMCGSTTIMEEAGPTDNTENEGWH
jgi:hypothetical protein